MTGALPLPHAYTNVVSVVGSRVTKRYRGPDRAQRQAREEVALRSLAGRLPVGEITASRPGSLTTRLVAGRPGQDLVEEGQGWHVLHALGALLRVVQAIEPSLLPSYAGSGVLVHGDYGPNNVVMSPDGRTVVLLADWEWCGVGDRVADLAWAELIIRLHHPLRVACLTALWEGYGERPAWPERQRAMTRRMRRIGTWARTWADGDARAQVWDERLAMVQTWHDTAADV